MKSTKFNIREIVLFAFLTAVMEAAKMALNPIPNVELVTLLVIVYTVFFGWKTYYIVLAFILLETLNFGIHLWVIMYMYVWLILIAGTMWLKRFDSVIYYATFAGFFGLCFGFLCALVYLPIGGWNMMITWWIAGLWYDILHCISNFVTVLLLYKPLVHIMDKMLKRFGFQ